MHRAKEATRRYAFCRCWPQPRCRCRHGARGAYAAAPAPRGRSAPDLIEAAQKEGKVIWYTAVDLPVAGAHRQGLRGQISGHRHARRALGRRAHLPAHRPGVRQQDPRRRRRSTARTRRISSSGSATASWRRTCPRTWRCHYPGRAQGPRRPVRQLAHLAVRDRLQHQAGEAPRRRRRASPTCSIPSGSARSSRPTPATAAPS